MKKNSGIKRLLENNKNWAESVVKEDPEYFSR